MGSSRAASVAKALVTAALLVLLAAACASRMPPALPAALRYTEFVYPAVPESLRGRPGVDRIDAGWRYLQNDDLRNAAREFDAAIRRNEALYPARAGQGYVELARGNHERAAALFAATLRTAPTYVPALVGHGQSLLELKRDADALASFEAALAADPSLTVLQGRIEVLRFRNLQELIDSGRRAAAAGRDEDARVAYGRALEASPESAFLHRELALIERRLGRADAALTHFRRAAELDPSDAASLSGMGELLEERLEFAAAEAAYRKAADLEPSPELTARIAAVAERAREAALPAEFRAIKDLPQITRGDLAALLAVRLEPALRTLPSRQAVVTDIRGHWAAPWIGAVVRAGIVDPFQNHTFQPRTRVRRVDLATAASRLLTVFAARNPELKARLAARPRIADMPPGHLSYPAVSLAVASGVIPLVEGQRFQVNRAVTGAEAVETIERLRILAQPH